MSNNAMDCENKGISFMKNNKLAEALDCFKKAYEEYSKTNNSIGLLTQCKMIGIVKMQLGELHEAKSQFLISLEMAQSLKYKEGIADCFANLGMLYILLREPGTAINYLFKGYQLSHEISYPTGLAYTGDLIRKVTNIQDLDEVLRIDADRIEIVVK